MNLDYSQVKQIEEIDDWEMSERGVREECEMSVREMRGGRER